MANFNTSIGVILQHEGGWVNNKNDPGGATNYGISLRWLASELKEHPELVAECDFDHDGDVDAEDIRQMPKEEAIKLYKEFFWDAFGYDRILNDTVATKVFDMCVNMGSRQAHKIVQRAARVGDDGVLGNLSFAAINAAVPEALLQAICEGQKGFYLGLIDKKPQLVEFKKGWLYRAAWPFHG